MFTLLRKKQPPFCRERVCNTAVARSHKSRLGTVHFADYQAFCKTSVFTPSDCMKWVTGVLLCDCSLDENDGRKGGRYVLKVKRDE